MKNEAARSLFDFFSKPDFNKCFFTGAVIREGEQISVFPEWILERYHLKDQYMGMLNWNRVKYGDIYIPCSNDAKEKIESFEQMIRSAFEEGYDAVIRLNPDMIFLWMSKLLLGILYHDITYSIELGRKRNKTFTLSPLLTRKYRDLHFMTQALVSNVKWATRPYSILIKKVDYSKDVFNFRDETRNQNFSLGMNGFGIVACLQDQGQNIHYHKDLIAKMGNTTLHAIQFEELCARFLYSNYLLREHNGWECVGLYEQILMQPKDNEFPADFGKWDDKMFASVLEDYWKPWGIEPKEIYTFPDSPLSFLINETTNTFIDPKEIPLPS